MKRLLLVLAAVLSLVAASCSAPGATGEDRVLPDETLQRLEGGDYALRQTSQPRALNLWATWCTPCRAELPAFDDVASRVEGVDIVGINVGDAGDDAAELVQELGLSFPQLLDPTATVQQSLRITGMPSTIFVDSDGTILQVHSGELQTEELETILGELFGATFN